MQFHHVIDGKMKVRNHLILIEQKTNTVALSKGVKKRLKRVCKIITKGIQMIFYLKAKKINQPIERVQAWQIMSDVAEELGLEKVGTHFLRKTFGYHQIKRGTNIKLLMKMFNHSSESVTLRYIGITQDDMDAAVQALDLLNLGFNF